jgi:O-antigen/teichoic acid export membrane protein
MGYAAWLNVLRGAVNIVIAAPLLALHYGVAGLAWAWVVTAYSNCLFGAWFLARVHPRVFSPVRDRWDFGALLRFSIPQTLTAMLLFAILWTDQVLVARFGTAEQVAIYAIATRVLSPATLVSSSTGQMFGPRIAAGDARGDRKALAQMLKRVTYWNTGISIPFFTMLLLIPGSLLGIFGHRYRDGATALVILAAGEIFNTVTGPIGQMINMSGRPYITLVNNFLVAGLNIALCIYLIPRYGLTGAAVSTTTSLTIVNVLRLLQVRLIFGFTPFRWDMLRLAAATGLSALAALPLMLLPHWTQPLFEVVVVTAAIFVVYGAVLWKLGVRDEVRQILRPPRARPALSHN